MAFQHCPLSRLLQAAVPVHQELFTRPLCRLDNYYASPTPLPHLLCRPLYLSTKNTILKKYDGRFMQVRMAPVFPAWLCVSSMGPAHDVAGVCTHTPVAGEGLGCALRACGAACCPRQWQLPPVAGRPH